MDDLITIATFNLPHELGIIRARLESEGIECFVRDELTIQTDNFYSNAIGGVKLQVRISDFEKANAILKEVGIAQFQSKDPMNFWNKIDNKTKNIKFISSLRVEMRFLVIVGILTTLPFVFYAIFFNFSFSSDSSKLMNNNWCMESVHYQDKTYYPNSKDRKMIGGCVDKVKFDKDKDLNLPGFNFAQIKGRWEMSEGKLQIFADTFQYIFDGQYEIEFSENDLILYSETTTIYCYK